MGRYQVSATTHRGPTGCYQASVALRSGAGMASHHRIWRFTPAFATREAARRYALAEGRALATA